MGTKPKSEHTHKAKRKGSAASASPKTPKKIGRPTKYSPEIADLICSLLIEGQSLRKICSVDGMPRVLAVLNWIRKYPEFEKQYAHARELQAEGYADEIVDIADDSAGDYAFKETEDGTSSTPFVLKDNIQRAKLRVDARKWIACKLLPKKYGDKIETQHSGDVTISWAGDN